MIRDVTLLVDEIYPESRVYTEVFFNPALNLIQIKTDKPIP